MPPQDGPPTRVKVTVSSDQLQAWAAVTGTDPDRFVAPSAADFFSAAEIAGLPVVDEIRLRIEEAAQACHAAWQQGPDAIAQLPEKFLLAQGRPAQNARDGRFEWAPDLKTTAPDDDEPIDYFALNAIVTVNAGTVIGKIIPPEDGVPSIDVFGNEKPPRRPRGLAIKLGPGVSLLSEESGHVVAENAGRVYVGYGQVRIDEVLQIGGDVNFSSGSVDACVDVCVRGTVRSNFRVRTTGSLSVGHAVEAADINVDGDVAVRGGVFGNTGHIHAKGSVTAALFNETHVDAGGDVCFNKEMLNSKINSRGHVRGERGTIIGGEVTAREGITVKVLGSEADVQTRVAVGISVNDMRRIRQLENKMRETRRGADQLRDAVKPLLENVKNLRPEQRERATELLSNADEIELQVTEMDKQAKRIFKDGAPKGKPYIAVGQIIYPGVELTVDTRLVRVQKLIHGPVKIGLREVNGITEVVSVNQRTGSVTVLHSREADLNAPPTEEKQPEAQTNDCRSGAECNTARNS